VEYLKLLINMKFNNHKILMAYLVLIAVNGVQLLHIIPKEFIKVNWYLQLIINTMLILCIGS